MNRTVLFFMIVAYALATALGLVVGLTGGYQSRFIGLGFATMFVPTIAVIVVRSVTSEGLRIDWNRFALTYIPLALFLIPATLHLFMLSRLAVAGPLPWQEWLTPQPDGLYHTPASRGWGVLTMPGVIARIAVNAGAGLTVVSFLTLFEEIGWRGWLLPRLLDRMDARSAIFVSAAIWALWHVPFALSGIQHVDGVSPTRLTLGAPFGIFATGLVIGWLWVRTENIWIVAVAHGALNNWGQYAFKYMNDFTAPAPSSILGTGFFGLWIVGMLLLAFGLPSRPGRGRLVSE